MIFEPIDARRKRRWLIQNVGGVNRPTDRKKIDSNNCARSVRKRTVHFNNQIKTNNSVNKVSEVIYTRRLAIELMLSLSESVRECMHRRYVCTDVLTGNGQREIGRSSKTENLC